MSQTLILCFRAFQALAAAASIALAAYGKLATINLLLQCPVGSLLAPRSGELASQGPASLDAALNRLYPLLPNLFRLFHLIPRVHATACPESYSPNDFLEH